MKGLRVAGHPVHGATVHAPMGLFMATAIWDVLAIYSGQPIWWQLAYYCLVLGLLATIPAAIAGFIDYLAIPNGHRAEKVGLYHLSAALSASTLYLASLLMRGGSEPVSGRQAIASLSLSGSALLLLILGGWLGGELVYKHRIGIDDGPLR